MIWIAKAKPEQLTSGCQFATRTAMIKILCLKQTWHIHKPHFCMAWHKLSTGGCAHLLLSFCQSNEQCYHTLKASLLSHSVGRLCIQDMVIIKPYSYSKSQDIVVIKPYNYSKSQDIMVIKRCNCSKLQDMVVIKLCYYSKSQDMVIIHPHNHSKPQYNEPYTSSYLHY